MRCEERAEAIAERAAGGRPAAELEEHLAGCAACAARLQRMVDALAAVDAALAGVRTAEPSAALAGRVRSAVARNGAPRPSIAGWVPAALAAGLLLALVGWLATRTAPRTEAPRIAGSGVPSAAPSVVPSAVPPSPPPPPAARVAVAARVTRRTVPTPAGLAIVVDPREAAALRRYLAGLEKRTLGPDALLVAGDTAPLPETKPLDVLSLDTPLLDSAAPPGF